MLEIPLRFIWFSFVENFNFPVMHSLRIDMSISELSNPNVANNVKFIIQGASVATLDRAPLSLKIHIKQRGQSGKDDSIFSLKVR